MFESAKGKQHRRFDSYSVRNSVLTNHIPSRKVVEKQVHVTIPRGSLGYDQYTVSDTVAVEPTFAASL